MDPPPSDSWRSWLVTGAPALPIDRRRMRGAHRGLKKMLVEGMGDGGERPWKDFSGAMVRHAVNEAVSQLPEGHVEVVKLAYFGGLSNREIAERLGISVAVVQRRLRKALARISDHIESGRAFARRAAYAFLGWLTARQLIAMEHLGGALVVAAATSAFAIQPAVHGADPGPAPAPLTAPEHDRPAPVAASTPSASSAGSAAAPATTASATAVQVPALPVSVPALSVPQVTPLPKLP